MEFTLVESKKKGNLKKNMNSQSTNQSTTQSTNQSTNKSTNHSTTHSTTQSNTQTTNQITTQSEQPKYEKKILTQEEMTDVLISKIRNYDNIDIKTKEINKEKGLFYAINVRADLSKIGNGVFHSAKINTVSHINRVVNIKMVFSDNETLHHDMKVNVDSLFQCFREIAPDTITNIHIETFKDQIDNEHLCIILSTIKGSSLTYVYKRMIDFVNVINEKYGLLPSPKYNKVSINDIADEMIAENNIPENNIPENNIPENTIEYTIVNSTESTIVNPTKTSIINSEVKQILPIEVTDIVSDKTDVKKEVIKDVNIEIKDNKSIINNSILNVIEQLEKEEKRLLLELENVRKLIKSQTSILEILQVKDKTIDKTIDKPSDKQTSDKQPSDKNSFAYKVIYGS
jgi:hypothetical protein